MKKKLIRYLLIVLFLLSLLPVYADASKVYAADSRRLVDDADLLDEDVEEDLARRLDNLAEQYGLDAAIITVQDYKTYDPSIYAYNAEQFASTYYFKHEFGFDEERSGIILLISMEERDWHIYIVGEARVAVNNYGFEYISERLVGKLGDDAYEKAIARYVDDLEDFFQEYDKGTPYGDDHRVKEPQRILLYFGVALAVSLVLALIIVSAMKSGMNTAKPQYAAREYVKQGSFALTQQQDLYLYSRTTKTPIPKESSSGRGGGGGRSSGSRGGSGGGGKF